MSTTASCPFCYHDVEVELQPDGSVVLHELPVYDYPIVNPYNLLYPKCHDCDDDDNDHRDSVCKSCSHQPR